jgi:hypothetical protein
VNHISQRAALRASLQWGALLGAANALVLGLRFLSSHIPLASDWEVYCEPIPRGWLEGRLVHHEGSDWMSGPSVFHLMRNINNVTPWHRIGFWMASVALVLAIWMLRLPPTRRNLGALVAANALVAPYLSAHSLVNVLTFSLLPLVPAWEFAGWVASFTVFLRGWIGKPAMHLDFRLPPN